MTTALSIRSLLGICVTAVITMLALATATIFWAFSTAELQLDRTVRSYKQLALAVRIEADIGRFLLGEIGRIVDPKTGRFTEAKQKQGVINNAIEQLIKEVSQEVKSLEGSPEELEEQKEFASAYAARALFRNMQHVIDRQHTLTSRLDSGSAVRRFMATAVSTDYHKLNTIISDITSDEREEVRERLREMDSLRQTLMSASVVTLTCIALMALLVSCLVYHILMRPLSEVAKGSAELARGNLAHRVSINGPHELSDIAIRFNEMARRISEQKEQLVRSNQALERTVEDRTRELKDKAQRLSDIDKSRRLFFAKIGHELRTPLTVIIGEADVALKNNQSTVADYRSALSHMTANGKYLKRRIADLMALARSENAKLQLQKDTMDVGEVVEEVMHIAKAYASSNDVLVEVSLVNKPAIISGDRTWLHQSIFAIVDNAIKYSSVGAYVKIMLNVDKEKRCCKLTVEDEGPGVPNDDLVQLFHPYFQSQSARGKSGSGLGLAVAKWVVDMHCGKIFAQNVKPTGLCVQLELPLVQ